MGMGMGQHQILNTLLDPFGNLRRQQKNMAKKLNEVLQFQFNHRGFPISMCHCQV